MVSVEAIAIYGAIISSIALTWNILFYLLDKPKIIPKYSTGFLSFSNNDLKEIFSINFSNPTKHRVVISSAGISFKNNYDMLFIGMQDGFPKTLLQGDSHTIYRDIDIIKKAVDEQGFPSSVWVKDATGKTYRGGVKNMVKKVEAMYKSKHKDKK